MKISKTRLFLVAGIATVVTVSHAKEVQGEKQRKSDNAARILKLNPYMRPKVGAIIADLEGHGYRPSIDPGVWRTPAEQAAKVKAGVSNVSYSFHNVSRKDGKPDSLAADIVDIGYQWKAPKSYWLKLASSAQSHDLTTGICWGLSTANRQKIHTAIARKDWSANLALGWDTAHVEPAGITIGQAKAGRRPS